MTDKEKIKNIRSEIMDVIENYPYDEGLTAVTICAISGYLSIGIDKKDFMQIMSESYDELLIVKMKFDER